MTPLLLTAWTVAAAQDTPARETPGEADEAPLALPVDQVHAPVPGTRAPSAAPERPLAIPGQRPDPHRSAARLQALKQYQRERMAVGTELEFRTSGPPVGVGFGGPWYGVHWGMMFTPSYTYATQNHGIYQGTTRLDVPDFLSTIGESNLRVDLEQDILRANRFNTLWNITTGVGVTGLIVGTIGMSGARNAYEYYNYYGMARGGLAMTLGGLIASSITSSKSFRLRRYPSASIGVDEAERLADGYNDQLREQLGLTPEDVWTVESQERPRR